MINILSSAAVPAQLLTQLRDWFEAEWGSVDPFEGNHADIVVPAPVVAVDDDGSLLGGLAFSSFPSPKNSDVAVWINALLISPSHRKRGIASLLIGAAELEAQRLALCELFVSSEYPDLYQALGWQFVCLDSSRNETVLTKRLASA